MKTTLAGFLLEEERGARVDRDVGQVLLQIGFAGKVLSREMRRAAIVGRLGKNGEANATGDEQKKLDVFGNDVVVEAFSKLGPVFAVISEEMAEPMILETAGQLILCTDPLDGSSNADINGDVGSIFSIYRRRSASMTLTDADCLRAGNEQLAAGYILYGPSTLFVLTTGSGVHGFTLDDDVGEFVMTHANIRCPRRGRYYSSNLGNAREWKPSIRRLVDYLGERDASTRRPYSLRYSGALVGDLHRCMLEGGLYFYPADAAHSEGKLRLLYECAPLAMLIEQAGGRASTGSGRVLDVRARSIHQRVPLVIGSADDVALYERFSLDDAA